MDTYTQTLTVNYSDVDKDNELTNRGILRLMQEVAGIHSGTLGYGVNDIPKTRYCLDYSKLEITSFNEAKN